jgi:N-hydroxyarylamine O-acetyltransferase
MATGQRMTEGFRLNDYLARIGFEGKTAPDFTTLSTLHAAHVASIPFETLDPFLGRRVSIDLPSIHEKMIEGRRGGYCYEQNTLFRAALEAIGFKVAALAGRVRWMSGPEAPLGPRTHMLLKVELAEGLWLADVGFGGCLLDRPLRLETGVEQRTGAGTYLLRENGGLFSLDAQQPGGWRTEYLFDLTPQENSDYEMANWYSSTHPRSIFLENLIMEKVAAGQRYKLVNRRYVVEESGGRVVEGRNVESAEDLDGILREVFNVIPPVPVTDVFARIRPA